MPAKPYKYKPEFCQAIIDYMAQGYSSAAFAGSIGVDKQTIYNWAKNIEDFGEALAVAQAKRTNFWETTQIGIATGMLPDGNAVSTLFALKNCDAEEWRDRRELVAPGAGDNGSLDLLVLSQRIAFLLLSGAGATNGAKQPELIEG